MNLLLEVFSMFYEKHVFEGTSLALGRDFLYGFFSNLRIYYNTKCAYEKWEEFGKPKSL